VQNNEIENIEYPAPNLTEKNEPTAVLIHPTPDNPPWNSWIAFALWLLSVAFILILPTLVVGVYLVTQGVDFSNREQFESFIKTDINANLLSIIAVIPAHILTLAAAWFVITNFNKFSFREMLGWRFDNFKIWYVFVITALILILAAILTSIFGQQENELLRILKSSRTAVYLVAFLATFTAPLVEEVIYRGLLYSAFQRTFGAATAILLVTFLFALVHVPQYYPDFVAISMICLVSLILTVIRAQTGNLLPCIALHFVFNGIQSLFLIFQPFLERFVENYETPAALFYYPFK
jgi:uncharacterized protein